MFTEHNFDSEHRLRITTSTTAVVRVIVEPVTRLLTDKDHVHAVVRMMVFVLFLLAMVMMMMIVIVTSCCCCYCCRCIVVIAHVVGR